MPSFPKGEKLQKGCKIDVKEALQYLDGLLRHTRAAEGQGLTLSCTSLPRAFTELLSCDPPEALLCWLNKDEETRPPGVTNT